jgi:PIN domain nuclease of toxin-antitoxin system
LNVLLDTCTFLWLVTDRRELSRRARDVFRSPENRLFLSAASAWEIALKHSTGRLWLADPPETFVPRERERHAIEALPIDEADALAAGSLPAIHRDPFDRLLVCQALARRMPILTPDRLIRRYSVTTIW